MASDGPGLITAREGRNAQRLLDALLASRGFETRIEDDDALGLKAARCVVVAGRRPGERAESSGA